MNYLNTQKSRKKSSMLHTEQVKEAWQKDVKIFEPMFSRHAKSQIGWEE